MSQSNYNGCNKADILLEIQNLNFWYGESKALIDITMKIAANKITALIGPSGCGKSTLIRCFNRMNDVFDNIKVEGKILFKGKNILNGHCEVTDLRKRIGMIFQKPNLLPFDFDNVAMDPGFIISEIKRF